MYIYVLYIYVYIYIRINGENSMLIDQKTQYFEMAFIIKLRYRLNAITMKILAVFFIDLTGCF
jgi:hypothetical protein